MTKLDALQARAAALHLHGLLAHWQDIATSDWVQPLLDWEEEERARRSLERRLQGAHIGRFKPICDFDWACAHGGNHDRCRDPSASEGRRPGGSSAEECVPPYCR